jgi:4-oxalocrotonate tautomerase
MPVAHLRMCPLLNPHQYDALANEITQLVARLLRKRADLTAVWIEDVPAARVAVGGHASTQPIALLRLSITRATTGVDEKEAFISAAFALLRDELAPYGPLHPLSYVIVEELAADAWGYGGKTQTERANTFGLATTP